MKTDSYFRCVIILKVENLLRNSEVIRNHYPLIEIMDKFPRATYSDLDNFEMSYVKEHYQKAFDDAMSEWFVMTDIVNHKERDGFECELCGKIIKRIFLIRNKHSKKILRIGSECVKHFE